MKLRILLALASALIGAPAFAQVTPGTSPLSLAKGGTGANLSATGGASNYVKQTSVGGPFTVGRPTAPDIAYTAPFTGGVAETQSAYNAQRISVKDFGAACDGTTDDTPAIQAALNTGKTAILPDNATCKTTAALTISITGTGLVGSGQNSSVLSIASATASALSINASINYVTLQNFKILRSGTPVSTAYGVIFSGDTQNTNISNLWIEGHYIGLAVRTTGFSQISNVVLSRNLNDGFNCTDLPGFSGFQWYITNVLSQLNGAHGYLFATGLGTTSASVGNWIGLYSFANTNSGLTVAGTAGQPINGIRLYNSFFGQDGQTEVFLDTFGSQHSIANTFLELAGTSTTGPAFSTPATHVGHGINVSANNVDVSLNNIYSTGHSQSGFVLSATALNALNNSRATSNANFGAVIADGSKAQLSGNSFASNTSGNLSIISNGASLVAVGNTPSSVNNLPLLTVTGPISTAAPTTKTANYTQLVTDSSLIFNGAGSLTLTLLSAASVPGQWLMVKTIAAQTVVSASSNVVPLAGGAAGTAILAGTPGKWASLQSDGTNWIIMAQGGANSGD